jgi:hypothetical protein
LAAAAVTIAPVQGAMALGVPFVQESPGDRTENLSTS